MKDEIKEILEGIEIVIKHDGTLEFDAKELKILSDYINNLQEKVNQYENPDDMTLFYMWLDEKAKDKIKQLQEENEKLKEDKDSWHRVAQKNYNEMQDKIDKAIEDIDLVIELIKQQPTEDDTWILNKLNGFKYLLQGEDKDE